MHIFINIFISLIFFSQLLSAKEPFLARLVNIPTNDIQEFEYGNIGFTCLPYGVISVDELYRRADQDSMCKKSIALFYRKRVDLKYFTDSKMNVYQSYSLLRKENNRCIINISGEKSLSEFLLEEGLAVKQPLFKDKEYIYYFFQTQEKAKEEKKGMWKGRITKDCAAYIQRAN